MLALLAIETPSDSYPRVQVGRLRGGRSGVQIRPRACRTRYLR